MFDSLIERFFGGGSSQDDSDENGGTAPAQSPSLQAVIEHLFGHEDVSNTLWGLLYKAIAMGAVLAITGVWGFLFWNISLILTSVYSALVIVGLGIIGGAVHLGETQQVTIPANPVSVAILSIWGKRQNVLIREGKVLRFKFWPFYMDLIVVATGEQNFSFCFEGVRCGASPDSHPVAGEPVALTGGKVSVDVSMTATPNTDSAERVNKFLNYGGWSAIKQVLDETTGESVRHTAINYDWETFAKMKAALTVLLLVQIADVDFHKLETNSEGLVDESMLKITPEQYAERDCIADPIAYLFPDRNPSTVVDPIEERRKEQEISVFLRIARIRDVADIMDLGIKIARLNVPEIEAEGAVDTASEEAAAEQKQRQAEQADNETRILNAKRLVKESEGADGKPTLTFRDALEIDRINKRDGRTSEHVYRGVDGMTAAAAVFASANKT